MIVVQGAIFKYLRIIGNVLHRLIQDAVNKPIKLLSIFVDRLSLTLTLLELSFDSLSAHSIANKH